MSGKIKNAFSEIHAEESLKIKTKQAILQKKKKKIPLSLSLSPIFIVILLTFYFTPFSYISIDINPSFILEVNAFNRIVKINAIDDDANTLLNSISIKHSHYIDAIKSIETTELFSPYRDAYKEITIISNTQKNSEKIMQNINQCGFGGTQIKCHIGTPDLKEQADETTISFGKYRVYLELLKENPDLKVEDISHLSMHQLQSLLNSKEFYEIPSTENNEQPQKKGHLYGNHKN